MPKYSPPISSSHALRLIEATKEYTRGGERLRAIDRITLDIPVGQIVAVIGRSGSGKSTLLNLLAGIDTVTSGHIVIDGVDINRMSDDELTRMRRDHIGVVYQFFNLLSTLTTRENVMLPALLAGRSERETSRRADELLDEVGMTPRRNALPHTLSGGEMQRAALARALIQAPKILLADEPTGNLDTCSADQVIGLLRDLGRSHGATVALVTHSAEAAAIADRLIELKDGRVVRDEG
jgi:ABC-type lipoprotein export system ATPase subunit